VTNEQIATELRAIGETLHRIQVRLDFILHARSLPVVHVRPHAYRNPEMETRADLAADLAAEPPQDFAPGEILDALNANGTVRGRYLVLDPPRTANGKLRLQRQPSGTFTNTWWMPNRLPGNIRRNQG